ncbi:MAG: YraN family protein [Chitinophagales bacterium]
MNHQRLVLGRAGEEVASAFLSARGWILLERNYRCRYGEIDLVGREGPVTVFVEVKTRASERCGSPEEALTWRKRRRLKEAAACYMKAVPTAPVRFDLVAVRVGEGEIRVKHYPNVVGRWS